jgi:hypothetical protein
MFSVSQLRRPPPNPRAPILFEACAGLGNRMRALASAMAAASDLSRNLLVLWCVKPNEFFGRFQDIFAQEFLPSWVVEFPNPTIEFAKVQKEVLSQADWDATCADRDACHEIAIKSHGQFYTKDPAKFLRMLRSLRPNPKVYSLIQDAVGPIPMRELVGVHIRRTDNQKSIRASPTPAFVVTMQAYPPTQKFYVATDDAFEREFLVHTFGADRIKFAAQSLERNSPFGAVDSMLDFVALSMCREILGSVGSSFSEMAAAYGSAPLRLVSAPP